MAKDITKQGVDPNISNPMKTGKDFLGSSLFFGATAAAAIVGYKVVGKPLGNYVSNTTNRTLGTGGRQAQSEGMWEGW